MIDMLDVTPPQIILVEKTEAHIVIRLVLAFDLLLLLLGRGRSCSSCRSSGGGSSHELGWILEVLLDSIGFLEFNFCSCGNGQQVLESIDDAVWSRGNGRVADGQAERSNVGNTLRRISFDQLWFQMIRQED
jgi:hypothetical protein